MKNERTTTDFERRALYFLDGLKKSDRTPMYLATPHLIAQFGLDDDKARYLLSIWLKNYPSQGNYELITVPR